MINIIIFYDHNFSHILFFSYSLCNRSISSSQLFSIQFLTNCAFTLLICSLKEKIIIIKINVKDKYDSDMYCRFIFQAISLTICLVSSCMSTCESVWSSICLSCLSISLRCLLSVSSCLSVIFTNNLFIYPSI